MKLLKRLITFVIAIIVTVGVLVIGGYLFIKVKYDIDLVDTVYQLNALSRPVDESALCSEPFSEADMVDAQTEVNKSVENMIVYTKEQGYNVSFDDLPSEMKCVIRLSDKQVGALADTIIKQEKGGKIEVGGRQVGIELLQVDFSEITEREASFNFVVKLDMTAVKSEMQGVPFGYLKKFIPSSLYLSSTVQVVKGAAAFEYGVFHRALTVNGLSEEETEDLFRTLEIVLNISSARSFNEQIGNTVVGALIGSETQKGLAYSLKDVEAVDYSFTTDSGVDYFVVLRGENTPSDTPDISVDAHIHELQHVAGVLPECARDGVSEHWHCDGCGKNFADDGGCVETDGVAIPSTGHLPKLKSDDEKHWYECQNCHQITAEEYHDSAVYLKNKSGHYKVCEVCDVMFAVDSHTTDEICSVCSYSADYADKCASDYGLNYLKSLENGENYQKFYIRLDETASDFHDSETKSATESVVNDVTCYIGGDVNYSDFGLTTDEAMSVWTVYRADHPLYYWMGNSVLYSSSSLSICVEKDYKDASVRSVQNGALYDIIDEYLNVVSGETSAYQTAFAFHDDIIENIEYAYDGSGAPSSESWAHNILGVFIKNQAVCEGYAKAFSLLLNACGVDNAFVTGTSEGVGHAWNVVEIENNWYWYDLTWDDQPSVSRGTVYNYMCKSGATLAGHTVGETGNMSDPMGFLYAIPTVSETDYNSFALEYGEEFTVDNLTYKVCGYNNVAFVGSNPLVNGSVNLTEKVENDGRNFLLVEIGSTAFNSFNKKTITYLFIPKSVEIIYNATVVGCSNLTSVSFEDRSGWKRTPDYETFENLLEEDLADLGKSASLLKETYSDGIKSYQYTWIKTTAI